MTDKRRYGIIEVRCVRRNIYYPMVNGQLWSEVEWSPSRRTWCIQDACGHCLAQASHACWGDRVASRKGIGEASMVTLSPI
jgi:hypothetical protein